MQQNSRESCQWERHKPRKSRRETETEIKLPEVNAEVLRQFIQEYSWQLQSCHCYLQFLTFSNKILVVNQNISHRAYDMQLSLSSPFVYIVYTIEIDKTSSTQNIRCSALDVQMKNKYVDFILFLTSLILVHYLEGSDPHINWELLTSSVWAEHNMRSTLIKGVLKSFMEKICSVRKPLFII